MLSIGILKRWSNGLSGKTGQPLKQCKQLDIRSVELVLLSILVADYEDVHYPEKASRL